MIASAVAALVSSPHPSSPPEASAAGSSSPATDDDSLVRVLWVDASALTTGKAAELSVAQARVAKELSSLPQDGVVLVVLDGVVEAGVVDGVVGPWLEVAEGTPPLCVVITTSAQGGVLRQVVTVPTHPLGEGGDVKLLLGMWAAKAKKGQKLPSGTDGRVAELCSALLGIPSVIAWVAANVPIELALGSGDILADAPGAAGLVSSVLAAVDAGLDSVPPMARAVYSVLGVFSPRVDAVLATVKRMGELVDLNTYHVLFAFSQLENASLIQVSPDSNVVHHALHAHHSRTRFLTNPIREWVLTSLAALVWSDLPVSKKICSLLRLAFFNSPELSSVPPAAFVSLLKLTADFERGTVDYENRSWDSEATRKALVGMGTWILEAGGTELSDQGRASTVFALASIYELTGDPDASASMYEKTVQVQLEVSGPDSVLVANMLFNYGIVLQSLPDHSKAVDAYTRAVDIYRRNKDFLSLANSMTQLGVSQEELGLRGDALASYDEAKKAMSKVKGGRNSVVAGIELNIGSVNLDEGNLDESLRAFERAQALFTAEEGYASRSVANALYSQGIVYQDKGDVASASRVYEASLAIREAHFSDDAHYLALGQAAVAESRYFEQDYDRALELFNRALPVFTDAGEVDRADEVLFYVTQIYTAWNDGKKAKATRARMADPSFVPDAYQVVHGPPP